MGAIGEAFGQTVPSVGSSGTTYASTINAILNEAMARLSTKVPVGSIAAATSPLDMNNQAVKNQSYSGFFEQSAAPTGAPFGRITYADGEFYMVTESGTVQMTNGGSIDVSSVGAIGGDYGGSDPALVEFVGSEQTYYFWDDVGGSVLADTTANVVNVSLQPADGGYKVSLTPDSGMTGSYTLTLPAAPPASGTSLLVMLDDGTVAFAEDEDVTNALGTDGLLHGDKRLQFNTANENLEAGSRSATPLKITAGSSNTDLSWLVQGLPDYARIKSVSFRLWKSSGAAAVVAMRTYDTSSATVSAYETFTLQTASGFTTATRTCSTPLQLSSGTMLQVFLTLPAATDYVMSFEIVYDKVL